MINGSRLHLSRRATCAGLLALPVAGCGVAIERPLFAADTHPGDYPTVKAVEWMAKEVARTTAGRVQIRTYPGGQLGEEKDALELAIFGGIDLVRVNLAPLNSIAPETIVPTLPFLFKDTAHMRRAMDGAPGEAILASLAPHGLIGLCFYDSGARSFYSTKGPIRAPSDMKGQKIRVQNSDLFVALVEALGGDATPMSFGEVYQALVQGVIDGAENNMPSFVSTRHFETAKTYSMTRHVMAPEVLAISAKRWAKLSPEDQRHLRAAAKASVPVMRDLWEARETEAKATLAKANTVIVEDIDQEAFVRAVRPLWEQFLKTPAQKSIAQSILALAEAA